MLSTTPLVTGIKAEGFQVGDEVVKREGEDSTRLVVRSAMSSDGRKVIVKPVNGGSAFVVNVSELALVPA